ncbi:hypothetical protein EMIT0347P_60318 [Pseudomonas sp. IT-347P]
MTLAPALPDSECREVTFDVPEYDLWWERACSRKRFVSYLDADCAAVFASRLAPTGYSR